MLQELNTIQLYKILEKDYFTRNIFKGIFPRDYLPKKIQFPSCFIVNTDKSNKPGEHWLAFYYDENGICYFFDSFGFDPNFYGLKKYLDTTSKSWTFNKKRFQNLNSKSCGYFSLLFLFLKSRNIDINKLEINEKILNFIFS